MGSCGVLSRKLPHYCNNSVMSSLPKACTETIVETFLSGLNKLVLGGKGGRVMMRERGRSHISASRAPGM